MEALLKLKRLEMAHPRTFIGEFDVLNLNDGNGGYVDPREPPLYWETSKGMLRSCMENFMFDLGYKIPQDKWYLDQKPNPGQLRMEGDKFKTDARKVQFREKFVEQVKILIGKEPRVVKNGDAWEVFYE